LLKGGGFAKARKHVANQELDDCKLCLIHILSVNFLELVTA